MERFIRTEKLIGTEKLSTLKNSSVLIFGVGGVGGYTVEALARCGVGKITVVDGDIVSKSNINRQIIASEQTVGKDKVEVIKERILSINPNCEVTAVKTFFLPENSDTVDFFSYDYIVDAVDTVTAKLEIIRKSREASVPVISCMGTGNKVDPTLFKIADIFETSVCPLCRVMRAELKKRGVDKLKVLYSTEKRKTSERVPQSIAFCPSVAGLLIASEVVKDLCGGSL